MRYVTNFLNVFFGTTRRMQFTLAGLGILYCLTHPAWTAAILSSLLQMAIMIFAIAFIWRKVFGGSPKKKSPN
ncbi:MAG: hypothetical protein JWN50_548 [Parcubacteria group bacterium]|nr:hypothetical protein [Parcubacteria group bacterium]